MQHGDLKVLNSIRFSQSIEELYKKECSISFINYLFKPRQQFWIIKRNSKFKVEIITALQKYNNYKVKNSFINIAHM